MSNSIPDQVDANSAGSTMATLTGVGNENEEPSAVETVVHPTPLAEALEHPSALPFKDYRGVKSLGRFSSAAVELTALLNDVGVYDLGWRRLIRCGGEDRVRWLNGMATNFVGNLEENAGCYSFILNAQGRIQGDLDIYRRSDCFWLETDAAQVGPLTTFLDRYIIMDDVTLEVQPHRTALGIAGPHAAAALAKAGLPVPSSTLHLSEITWRGHSVVVAAAHSPLVPRYEIWMEHEFVFEMWNALQSAGGVPCGVAAIESLRVLEGTPAYSIDITAKDLPQETNQMRALHFNKGCYLGQEIVERIHSRGNVHRTFTGFVLADDRPTPGTPLVAEGKPVGEITSVARIELPDSGIRILALGSIRREVLERKSALMAAETSAFSAPLPFKVDSK